MACQETYRNATHLFLAKPRGQPPTPPGALQGVRTSIGAELAVRNPPLALAALQTLAHGETCNGSERKQWACLLARSSPNGAHAWRNLSCTALGCRSWASVLILSKAPLIFIFFFDLSKGFMVLSCGWLDFISFLSAQCAGCLLHPPLLHQAGILEELCVVLASS